MRGVAKPVLASFDNSIDFSHMTLKQQETYSRTHLFDKIPSARQNTLVSMQYVDATQPGGVREYMQLRIRMQALRGAKYSKIKDRFLCPLRDAYVWMAQQ